MNRPLLLLLLGALMFSVGATSGYLWYRAHQQKPIREPALVRVADSGMLDLNTVAESANASRSEQSSQQALSSLRDEPTVAISIRKQAPNNQSSSQAKRAEKDPVLLAQQRESLRQMFPNLEAALGLENGEARKLLDILAEHQLEAIQDPPHVPQGDLEWDPNNKPKWVLKQEAKQRARDRKIAALIGEEKFRAWEAYRESAGARLLVRELRSVLDGSSSPLRNYQIPLVTSALTEAQQRYSAESQYYQYDASPAANVKGELAADIAAINEAIARTEQYNEYLLYAASQYLLSDQQEKFADMLNERLDVERAYRDRLRSQRKGGNGT